MKKLELAIQVVNFNTKSYTIDCLQSVFKDMHNTKISFEINVLDNDSQDDLSNLKNFFTPIQGDRINVFQSDKNLGFGGGHNYLAKKTKAEYLLVLNPDIIIEEQHSIKKLYQRMLSDSSIKVIGPKLYNKEGKDQVWDHGESKGLLAKILTEIGFGFYRNRDEETDCAWVSGAVLLIEKIVFDQMNGFDENFFLYKEEEDLCLRMKKANKCHRVLYFPQVRILHFGSVVAKKGIHFSPSIKYYLKKHKFGSRLA